MLTNLDMVYLLLMIISFIPGLYSFARHESLIGTLLLMLLPFIILPLFDILIKRYS